MKNYLLPALLIFLQLLSVNPAVTAQDATNAGDVKTYNNYDFVPGQTVLFEDHFESDQAGEFPAHWKLESGQAVMNNLGGLNALLLTEGNYAIVYPRMKTLSYLTDPFTFELDYMQTQGGGYGVLVRLIKNDSSVDVALGTGGDVSDGKLSANYPGDATPEGYRNKWHHLAIACKNNQLKVYVDQYRVLVDPDLGFAPASLKLGGIGDGTTPIVFSNVRIASGGGMNMIGKKFTDSKIVTHGINFDYNKATLRPESMGTLNMIVKVMKDNPDLKFEVGGHTDGDGDEAYNMTLSQQRADAIRYQLIAMGIDGSRLKSKGYGKTKPISDNSTEQGKANNRRVEFVKI